MSEGAAEIGFARRDGVTRLTHLFQSDPLRVLFPTPESGDLPQAVLVTTSGGLVAGDRLRVEIRLGAEAGAHVGANAAEKIYRSTGATTQIKQSFGLEAGALLEFLPPETILFDDARLRRQTNADLAPGSMFLGGGIIVFGRHARGESLTRGLLHERWEIRREGVLVWGDALHIDGDVAGTLADPACFEGAAACATLIFVTDNPSTLLEAARGVQAAASGVRTGITIVNGVMVARWLATDAAALRRAYADLARHLRHEALGLPPHLPRLWQA